MTASNPKFNLCSAANQEFTPKFFALTIIYVTKISQFQMVCTIIQRQKNLNALCASASAGNFTTLVFETKIQLKE